MTQEELIQRLGDSRDEFLDMLDGLDDDDLLAPGVSGDRSIKDILVHLTLWEAQLITLLFRMGSGNRPDTAHFKKESRDQINAGWQRQHAGRPLEQVLDDFSSIRNQTIRRVEAIPGRDLEDPRKYRWLSGKPLRDWILRDTVDHEQGHLAQIQTWLDKR